MKPHRRCVPYIRRMRAGDRGNDFRTQLRMLVFFPRCMVMVQRGCSGVVACARTRREIIDSILFCQPKTGRGFRRWSNKVGARARG